MKSIVIAATLAGFVFCAPALASAQQEKTCENTALSRGYSAHDVKELCAGRNAATEHQQPVRTATNVPPGAIIDATHRLARLMNQGQRRGNRHGMYQGDRDLLELESLGPHGRVIKNRRAPGGAIPCIVRGVRGKCVPR